MTTDLATRAPSTMGDAIPRSRDGDRRGAALGNQDAFEIIEDGHVAGEARMFRGGGQGNGPRCSRAGWKEDVDAGVAVDRSPEEDEMTRNAECEAEIAWWVARNSAEPEGEKNCGPTVLPDEPAAAATAEGLTVQSAAEEVKADGLTVKSATEEEEEEEEGKEGRLYVAEGLRCSLEEPASPEVYTATPAAAAASGKRHAEHSSGGSMPRI